jgi:hypothetical protein
MNKKYFNNKYNLIMCSSYILPKLPENVIVRKGKLEDVAFTIRQEELDNDEVFNGNIIVNHTLRHKVINFKRMDFNKILKIKLNDNTLYTTNYRHTPYIDTCVCESKLMYCSSFILWIISRNFEKYDDKTFYGICRTHRIGLKKLEGIS